MEVGITLVVAVNSGPERGLHFVKGRVRLVIRGMYVHGVAGYWLVIYD